MKIDFKIITELKRSLEKLPNPTYDSIDSAMRILMKKYSLTAKELHYGFKNANEGKTPDEWLKTREGTKKTFREFCDILDII